MAYHEELITGKTDVSGNAVIHLGPVLQYEDVFFIGYVIAECVDGSSANYRLLNPVSQGKLGGFAGQMAVVGPMFLRPQQNFDLVINGGPPNTPITGSLVGDVHPDPGQLVLRPIPTAAGQNVGGLTTFAAITSTGPADLQAGLQVEGNSKFAGPDPHYDPANSTYAGGAKGDGVTDDTAALNAALSTAGSVGGTVHLGPGTFPVASMAILKSATELAGSGQGASIITGAFAGGTGLLGTVHSGQLKTTYHNVAVRNLTLKSGLGHALHISNTNGVKVEGVELFFTSATIVETLWLEHCQNVSLAGNYLHDFPGDGIQVNSTDVFAVTGNLVIGNSVADDLIDIDRDFLDTGLIPSRWGTVTGNVCRNGNAGNGIRVEDSQHITVSGNTIDNITAGNGIVVNSAVAGITTQFVTVSGNTISNCLISGIKVEPESLGAIFADVVLDGNLVESCGSVGGADIRAGIRIGTNDVSCTGNTVVSCGGNDGNGGGIVVYKGDFALVEANKVRGCTFGIRVWNGNATTVYTDVTIRANKMRGNGTDYVDAVIQQGVHVSVDDAVVVNLVDALNVALDGLAGGYYILVTTAAVGANRNIAIPSNRVWGKRLVLDIKNGTGGGQATTFSGYGAGGWLLAGAWVDPAATKRRKITFTSDGAGWVEDSRVAADL